jgi:hypothetical protein
MQGLPSRPLQEVYMTITEYVTNLPKEILLDECLQMIESNQSRIETFIDRLIKRNHYAEEDDSSYSTLIPRLQAKFDAAMQEASFLVEYEKSLNWSADED